MNVSCVACRTRGSGMVAIYHHPNGLDQMFTSVTGIEVEAEDHLCIPCYDDLRAAHLFKQKCIQNNILRISRPSASRSCPIEEPQPSPEPVQEVSQTAEPLSSPKCKVMIPNPEISTTVVEADILEEHLDFRSDVSEPEELDEDEEEDIDTEMPQEDELDEERQLPAVPPDEPHGIVDIKPVCIQLEDQAIAVESNVEIMQEEQLIQCEVCSKAFNRITLLNRHMKTCHQAAVESTDDGELSASGLLATLPTVHNLMCEYCFQEFTVLTEKFTHETSHVSEAKPYRCPNCQSTFKDKVGLRSHIRIHSAVKRYKCQYCDMRFHQRGNLTAHERTHVGAKPFLCPHCGKGFAESGNLKNHIRYHTGERPYACSECPKRFRTHYSRTVHYRSHSNERPFRCTECDKGFYSSGKLIIHRRVHSGEKPYSCGSCSAKFADSSGLKRHTKTH